ncbi:hypothetical protein PN498_14920 [Oscillatoria sp. CS-180]|uniref:hypothetical protein n=1 Tax=Oscillatoria sp. CS-180 TaxID=3021720 RepID=UPI00232B2FE1|nr:hypothetical protein [Oscillatoria sp. CS-180]MDB9527290.1 hypothetical protein [Oscillatoria sp. CS-180]
MHNPYVPSDIETSPIMGSPANIDRIAYQLKEQVRNNIVTFLRKEFSISALDLFSFGPKGLQARPNLSQETAEALLKIAASLTDFNGRRLCSKADAQRFAPLASAYPKELQFLWSLLQHNCLGIALLNVGTVMFIRSCPLDILPKERVPRHAVVTQPGGRKAVREGDYDRPLIDYFVPYSIPEWHDFDHIVATAIDDRFGNDLATVQKIPNQYTQLNSADPNYLVYLAPDDMTKFPIDSDYGLFQRIAPWFYRRALLQGMAVEETIHYVTEGLVGFLCRQEPAGDFRTSRKLFLPSFSHEYNAQKRAALVWGSWGEVPSKEVSPYITFLDKEEPGLTAGLINSDPRVANSAIRILFTIAEHEQSPPTARRLITEMAYARASMTAARVSLDAAQDLDPQLKAILVEFVDAYDFENPSNRRENHPVEPLRRWADWYHQEDEQPQLFDSKKVILQ